MTLNAYGQLISEVTGITDANVINEIEEMMRAYTGGVLSEIDYQEFVSLARDCEAALYVTNKRRA